MKYSIRSLAAWLASSSSRKTSNRNLKSVIGQFLLEDRLPPGDALYSLMTSIGFASDYVDNSLENQQIEIKKQVSPIESWAPIRIDGGKYTSTETRQKSEPQKINSVSKWLGNPEDSPTSPANSSIKILAPRSEVISFSNVSFAIVSPNQNSAPASNPPSVAIDPPAALILDSSLFTKPVQSSTVTQSGAVVSKSNSNSTSPANTYPAYTSRGVSHVMVNDTSRVAVSAAGGRNEINAVATANNLTIQRWVTDSIAVLQGPAVKSLASTTTLTVVPVFVPKESGHDAILFDQVIVRLQPGVTASDVFSNDPRIASYQPLPGTNDQFILTTSVGSGLPTLAVSNVFDSDKRVVWAEPNFYQDWQQYYTPNDTFFGDQWHLNNTGQHGGVANADVNAPEAWDITQGGSSSVVVAVIDTAMEYNHPDLAANHWTNSGEIPGNGIDDDNNGWVDDVNGWDFTTNGTVGDNDPLPGATDTNNDHATSVAGVIAAKGDNNLGVTGIAYQSKIMPVRIFGSTGSATTDANIASAINYAVGRTIDGNGKWNAATITNNSWGGGAPTAAIQDAFDWGGTNGRNGNGVPSFIATGNGFATSVSFPASLSGTAKGVIAIGASNISDVRSDYSNYGPQIDFVAPSDGGVFGIVTTDRVGANGYNSTSDYTIGGEFGGTSSATPLAAGTGALILSQAPSLTAEQLRGLMRNTTDLIGGATYDPTTGFNIEYGRGRIDAFSALKSIGKAEISVTSATKDLVSGSGTVETFNSIYVGQTSTLSYHVRNQGTTTLNLSNLAVSGTGFSVGTNFGSTALAVGESTSFVVAFAPTVSGNATGAVTFTSNDSDEGTFTFSLNGSAILPSVAGKTFEDWNGNNVLNTNDPNLGGVKLFADANANGTLDRFSVTNTVNLPIPDNDPAGATTSTTVTGQSALLSGLTVQLNITHTWDGDLQLFLIAPNGTTLTLASNVGGSGDNFTNTVFDDTATVGIASGAAPFTGSFKPVNAFSTLGPISPNGNWTLKVVDTAAADTGTLIDWTLGFDTEASTISDSQGNYFLPPIGNGTYSVLPITPSGWTTTSPLAGVPVTISNATPSITGVNIGFGKNNRSYLRVLNDQNADGVFQSTEPGLGGRFLYVDGNNNGVYDPPASGSFSSGTIAVDIPDNTTVTSSINVSTFNNLLTDVNVTVNLTHTWDGDLVLTLIDPLGNRVLLSNRRGGSGDNYTGTIFDDQASKSITAGASPFTGSFRPEGVLSSFNGEVANGNWTLEVQDKASGDTGTLTNWSLDFVGSSDPLTTNSAANGNAFFDLPNGSAHIRLDPLTSWKYTNPNDGHVLVNAAGAPVFESRFGTAESVPPTVATNKIADGTAQRSIVKSLTITFSEHVTFTGSAASAITISKSGGGTVTPTAVVDDTGSATVVTVGFADGTQFGSLLDGDYTLTVDASKVKDIAQNQMAANFTISFHRLFGDGDGDHDVDTIDLGHFRQAFGSVAADTKYNPAYDYESDGDVDTVDLGQFRRRFAAP